MKNILLRITLFTVVLSLCSSLISCRGIGDEHAHETTGFSEITSNINDDKNNINNGPYVPTIFAVPTDEQTIPLLSGNAYKFCTEYTPGISEKYWDLTDQYYPEPATISWSVQTPVNYYTVLLSQKSDMSEAQSFVCLSEELKIEDLFMGTQYYYQVLAHYDSETVKSRIFSFVTAYLPRTVYIEGASNTRDFGGYYTADGKYRIKQGVLYRGGHIDDLTDAGRDKMLNVYGIKTELDLRGTKSKSPLGDSVNFVNVSGPYYQGTSAGLATTNEAYLNALRTEIRTFADPANYPIFVHCAHGRDRTGTIVFLILALCGVEGTDLWIDYEISLLSYAGTDGGKGTYNPASRKTQFQAFYNYVQNYLGQNNRYSLAENTEAYMKTHLGITDAEIAAIRSFLMEEVK
ncbi:MAG: tyrosine-protein phosphatase [Ruminococcaceae bacterium]|nr:tyrosine-protein phosphatase [Oscillospiraceae bacterium]